MSVRRCVTYIERVPSRIQLIIHYSITHPDHTFYWSYFCQNSNTDQISFLVLNSCFGKLKKKVFSFPKTLMISTQVGRRCFAAVNPKVLRNDKSDKENCKTDFPPFSDKYGTSNLMTDVSLCFSSILTLKTCLHSIVAMYQQ